MNVAQYSPNKRMEREAIGSLDALLSVKESLKDEGVPGERRLGESDDIVGSGVVDDGEMRIDYAIDADGRAFVVRCQTDSACVRVPETIEGHAVCVIGSHAFSTCYKLEDVVLPATVSEIREHAFMNTALRSFAAPASLERIGAKAFYKCARLERVELFEGLRSIGEGAFCESALARLVVPDSVEYLGRGVFTGTKLVVAGDDPSLVFGESSRFGLDSGALYKLDGDGLVLGEVLDREMVEYRGPSGLYRIADRAFSGLKSLRCAKLPEGVVAIGEAAFRGCPQLVEVQLPDTVRSIGRRTFGDTALAALRIPASLEAIGAAAFYTGGTVTRHFRPTIRDVRVADANVRFYIENDTLCQRLDEGGAVALLHFGQHEELVIPRSVTRIGPYAYTNNVHVRTLVIHDRLESIDVGGLDFTRTALSVVFEVGDVCPKRYVVTFPPGEAGSQTMRMALGLGHIDIEFAFTECDSAILATYDTFVRAKMIVERLTDPVFLGEQMRARFVNRLLSALPVVVVEFGRNGYLQGIDALLDLGLLDESTIGPAIDAAIEADEVAVVSRLIEARRVRFGTPLFDFEL